MLDHTRTAFSHSSAALATKKRRIHPFTRRATCNVESNSASAATFGRPSARAVVPAIISDRQSTVDISESLVSQGLMRHEDTKLFGMLSPSRAALFAEVLANRTRHITFVLDGVYGAHNLAAIVRSCDAWGLQDLHVIAQPEENLPKQTKGTSEDTVRSESVLKKLRHEASVQSVSKNCDKWLTLREYKVAGPCLDGLRRTGYRIFVSSLQSDAKSIHDLDLSGKCAFVFGNEKRGVTAEMEAQADEFFTIPMMGFVESMNVSVAVGTTAALTTTRCRSKVGAAGYFLSAEEKMELAHDWLTARFNSKKTPKPLHTRRDVTKLGCKAEGKIVEEGMFATVSDGSLRGEAFWPVALRLTGDGGMRVATDVVRRKIGVLGEFGFQKRCRAINFFVAGSHALSCEAALSKSGKAVATRETLYKFFEVACDQVSEQYAPNFDQFGVPTLPPHFEESGAIFHALVRSAPRTARISCLQFASQVLGMNAEEVKQVIETAGIRDVARCIADTIRCGEEQALELEEVTANEKQYADQLRPLLNERHPSRETLNSGGGYSNDTRALLSQRHRDSLQVFLRLSNATELCSEMYQTFWDRHLKRNNVARIHALNFNLLESLVSDAYAEMKMLKFPHALALFRVVFEWSQVLQRLKQYFEED